jgi:hypothetical protein
MKENLPVRLPDEVVMEKIYVIRGMKVMLDRDLAELYGVETRRLKEQVRRNIDRFPEDFMFELTDQEYQHLKEHFSKGTRGAHSKYPPFAFTEHGVLMLSSVLNSERATKVNIQIMRVYVRIREMMLTHKDLLLKMERLEKRMAKQDEKIALVFKYLKKFIDVQDKPRNPVGYKQSGK